MPLRFCRRCAEPLQPFRTNRQSRKSFSRGCFHPILYFPSSFLSAIVFRHSDMIGEQDGKEQKYIRRRTAIE